MVLFSFFFCVFSGNKKPPGQESTDGFLFIRPKPNYFGISTLSTTWITPFD